MPGAQDGPVRSRRRGQRGRYGPEPRPAGAGQLTGVRRRARRASARQGAAGRRPTVPAWPTALRSWPRVPLSSPVTHFAHDYALTALDPAPGPDGWRAAGAPLKP